MQSNVTICRSQDIRITTFDTTRKIELKIKLLIDFVVLFILNRIKIQWYIMIWHTFTAITQWVLEITFRVHWIVFRASNSPYFFFLINGKLTWISSLRITKHTELRSIYSINSTYMHTNVTYCLLCSLTTTIATTNNNNNKTSKKCTIRTNICIKCIKCMKLLSGDFCNVFSGTHSLIHLNK